MGDFTKKTIFYVENQTKSFFHFLRFLSSRASLFPHVHNLIKNSVTAVMRLITDLFKVINVINQNPKE